MFSDMMHGLDGVRLENSAIFVRSLCEARTRDRRQIIPVRKKVPIEIYLEGWLSPRRFRRSRRRRCNGVGALGLKATRYHKGWLRSLLSHVNVGASAWGWRAT